MGKYDVSPGNNIPKRPRLTDAQAQAQLRGAGGWRVPIGRDR